LALASGEQRGSYMRMEVKYINRVKCLPLVVTELVVCKERVSIEPTVQR